MATQFKNLSDFSHLQVDSAAPYVFGIVVAQWNADITGTLYEGAYKLLLEKGALPEHIHVAEVPGSYELTSGADMLLNHQAVDAVICLGCVIQGETPHFDYICQAVANGITNVSLKHNKPAVFGVLTTDNLEQAKDRAGGRHGNKGEEAAITAIQMAALHRSLQK